MPRKQEKSLQKKISTIFKQNFDSNQTYKWHNKTLLEALALLFSHIMDAQYTSETSLKLPLIAKSALYLGDIMTWQNIEVAIDATGNSTDQAMELLPILNLMVKESLNINCSGNFLCSIKGLNGHAESSLNEYSQLDLTDNFKLLCNQLLTTLHLICISNDASLADLMLGQITKPSENV